MIVRARPSVPALLGLALLLLPLLPACPGTPGADDDDAGDDDIAGDDDSTAEEEPVARPEGADLGVPGWFVGMKATTEVDGEPVFTTGVEVELVAPTSGRSGPPSHPGATAARGDDPSSLGDGAGADPALAPLRAARRRMFPQEVSQ